MARIQDLQDLVSNALDVVEFKLIRSRSDLENDQLGFHPLMAHQIFGESENIFGYEGLKVSILYTAGPLHIYVGMEYEKKVDDLLKGDMNADDVVRTIAENLPDGCYFVNKDEFLKTLDKAEKFKPYGDKLFEYTQSDGDGKERIFEFYHSNYSQSPFLKFFSRLQTFVLWFVDAASYIDVDDPQWSYFICYEKYKNENGMEMYATVGYTTVYEYYAYPQNIRPRISQILVLPPFQRMGIATTFLETIYKFYQSQKNVTDITVEDPSDDFQRIRNYIDVKLCMKLKSFQKEELKKGFSKDMAKEAKEILKINPRQCRKVYEILRLFYTNTNDEEDYTSYRLEVKKRLNAVYHKQLSDIKKMEKAKMDTEWLRARLPTMKLRIEQLGVEYDQLETEYKKILEKVRGVI